jgi:hypothetical protein
MADITAAIMNPRKPVNDKERKTISIWLKIEVRKLIMADIMAAIMNPDRPLNDKENTIDLWLK